MTRDCTSAALWSVVWKKVRPNTMAKKKDTTMRPNVNSGVRQYCFCRRPASCSVCTARPRTYGRETATSLSARSAREPGESIPEGCRASLRGWNSLASRASLARFSSERRYTRA
jgi:hypothetical protein